MSDAEFLRWLKARLVTVYGESENVDFVLRLEKVTEHLEKVTEHLEKANDLIGRADAIFASMQEKDRA